MRYWTLCVLLASGATASTLNGQVLSLDEARIRAIQVSPGLLAGRADVDAAAARARQAGAFPNPVLSYGREQTSGAGVTNWQNIALLEQRLDFSGQRGAMRAAADLRREAASARLGAREADLAYEVTRAYATAVAADQRSAGARDAAEAFVRAQRVTAARLAGGDISGYASRRIGLEAARYATLRAEAELQRRTARLALAALLGMNADSGLMLELRFDDALETPPAELPLDSLSALALRARQEIRAIRAEAEASAADARARRREVFPGPVAGLGFKNELIAGEDFTASGFVLQLSVPVPLWDRRRASGGGGGLRRRGDIPGRMARRGARLSGSRIQLCHLAGRICHSARRPGTGRRRPTQLRIRICHGAESCCSPVLSSVAAVADRTPPRKQPQREADR